MSIKFLVLGGGGRYFGFWGGGSADFIFMGASIFLNCGFFYRKNRAVTPEGGGVVFWEGCVS